MSKPLKTIACLIVAGLGVFLSLSASGTGAPTASADNGAAPQHTANATTSNQQKSDQGPLGDVAAAPPARAADAELMMRLATNPALSSREINRSAFTSITEVFRHGSKRAVVATGAHDTCVRLFFASGASSGGCGLTKYAVNAAKTIGVTAITNRGWDVGIVLPSSVETATITTSDGKTAAVPIDNGFGMISVVHKPKLLQLETVDGPASIRLAAPSRTAEPPPAG